VVSEDAEEREPEPPAAGERGLRVWVWLALLAVLAAAAVAGGIALARATRDDPKPAPVPSGPGAPRAATQAELVRLATRLGHAVYWLGPAAGNTYEATELPDGRVFVRYLPSRKDVGTDDPYLTVGTYPLANAYRTTIREAAKARAKLLRFPSGAVAFVARPATSVYVAFPGFAYQVEVFDPARGRALAYVNGGELQPIRPA
jgi:hypothetical protein